MSKRIIHEALLEEVSTKYDIDKELILKLYKDYDIGSSSKEKKEYLRKFIEKIVNKKMKNGNS
ncbi:hypothetical protein HYW75_03560 [Candidatus Pacearchaeota archaeon]|nr:hypothetical protein [Candidatus Pacearchaeota archaeon]